MQRYTGCANPSCAVLVIWPLAVPVGGGCSWPWPLLLALVLAAWFLPALVYPPGWHGSAGSAGKRPSPTRTEPSGLPGKGPAPQQSLVQLDPGPSVQVVQGLPRPSCRGMCRPGLICSKAGSWEFFPGLPIFKMCFMEAYLTHLRSLTGCQSLELANWLLPPGPHRVTTPAAQGLPPPAENRLH